MNFEEVLPHLRAGRGVKRKDWTGDGGGFVTKGCSSQNGFHWPIEDLLADDWEVDFEKRELTAQRLEAVWNLHLAGWNDSSGAVYKLPPARENPAFKAILLDLGFKEEL